MVLIYTYNPIIAGATEFMHQCNILPHGGKVQCQFFPGGGNLSAYGEISVISE